MTTRIPDDAIILIREMTPIVAVIEEYTELTHTEGVLWRGVCPLPDCAAPALEVAGGDRNVFKCHGCGRSGDILGFIQCVEGLSWRAAVKAMYDRAGLEMPEVEFPEAKA